MKHLSGYFIVALFAVIFGIIVYFAITMNSHVTRDSVPNDPPLQVTVQDGVRVWKVYDRTHGCKRWIYFTTGEPSKVWPAP